MEKEEAQRILHDFFLEAKELYQELRAEGAHEKNLAEGDIVTEIDHQMTELAEKISEQIIPEEHRG